MRILLIVGILSAALASGCSPSEASQNNTPPLQEGASTMEVASRFMQAMGQGDMETMASLMDDLMVWHNEGDKAMPWIGPWKGKDEILETFFPLFGENFQTTKWETEDALAQGDVAVFFGKMKGITTKSGEETGEFTFALRVKVKDGKIVLWNWLEDSYEVSQKYHAQ
ncbi:MAG: nuclear transport factor 2 family protein [Bacteroidota bacterium]